MSLAELKSKLDNLQSGEQYELYTYLGNKLPRMEPARATDIDRIMKEMDEGKKIYWKDIRDQMLADAQGDDGKRSAQVGGGDLLRVHPATQQTASANTFEDRKFPQ